ncbi:MAG: hypothetical protein HUU21_30775 [Polyangiaceae bacterium]|nr:hypothetical protein [Polyangiaceae bacterium]
MNPFPVLFALTLIGCGKDPPAAGADVSSATTSASPVTSAAVAAPPATNAPAAAPSPATSAVAPPAAPASPEPSLKEWDATKLELGLLKNWDATGCVARRVREWIRVGCSAPTSKAGMPMEIQIVKGFPASKLSILKERGGSTMLVFPATPGLDGEALFVFAEGSYQFVSRWPAGQPEPKPIGSFEKIEVPAEEAAPGGSEPSDEAPVPEVSAEPLPTEPVIEGAPTASEWQAAREVGVKGSSALGCETKQINDWFRMVCRAHAKVGKVTSGVAVRGVDTAKGYVVTGNGALILLTQFVKGTDTAIDIVWENTSAQLVLKWPETAAVAPSPRGEFVKRP